MLAVATAHPPSVSQTLPLQTLSEAAFCLPWREEAALGRVARENS